MIETAEIATQTTDFAKILEAEFALQQELSPDVDTSTRDLQNKQLQALQDSRIAQLQHDLVTQKTQYELQLDELQRIVNQDLIELKDKIADDLSDAFAAHLAPKISRTLDVQRAELANTEKRIGEIKEELKQLEDESGNRELGSLRIIQQLEEDRRGVEEELERLERGGGGSVGAVALGAGTDEGEAGEVVCPGEDHPPPKGEVTKSLVLDCPEAEIEAMMREENRTFQAELCSASLKAEKVERRVESKGMNEDLGKLRRKYARQQSIFGRRIKELEE